MCRVFVIGNKIKKGLSQNIVVIVYIDGHGDGCGLLFHLVIGNILCHTRQIFLDVLQFVAVFLHEKVDDDGGVFKHKIDHTRGYKHIHHGEHVASTTSFTGL